MGAIILHGPHHSAQKSTMIGWSLAATVSSNASARSERRTSRLRSASARRERALVEGGDTLVEYSDIASSDNVAIEG